MGTHPFKKLPFTNEEQNIEALCFEKRRTTNPIFRSLSLKASSYVLLMAGSHDNDPGIMRQKRIPKRNIHTFDMDAESHAYLKSKGYGVPPEPMELTRALAYYAKIGKAYNLIYLDFYGLLTRRYLDAIRFIFAGDGMIAIPGTLVVTTGFGRPTKDAVELQEQARKEGWKEDYPATPLHLRKILAANGVLFRKIEAHPYRSHTQHMYVVTVVSF